MKKLVVILCLAALLLSALPAEAARRARGRGRASVQRRAVNRVAARRAVARVRVRAVNRGAIGRRVGIVGNRAVRLGLGVRQAFAVRRAVGLRQVGLGLGYGYANPGVGLAVRSLRTFGGGYGYGTPALALGSLGGYSSGYAASSVRTFGATTGGCTTEATTLRGAGTAAAGDLPVLAADDLGYLGGLTDLQRRAVLLQAYGAGIGGRLYSHHYGGGRGFRGGFHLPGRRR